MFEHGDLNRGFITLKISITEMGRISLALDHALASKFDGAEMNPQVWTELIDKWDHIYRDSHRLLDNNILAVENA